MFKEILRSVGLSPSKKQTKDIAKDRLKLVLMHERIQLAPEKFEKMRREIIDVIRKYMEIDLKETDIKVKNTDSSTAFILNARVLKVKD
ncbi:MAG: cell division topological specificity factor MinE [Nitrospirae bacterium]|nr:MAG: cell division topological specificity factor MinE [Nitrospirota bacterium]